MDPSSLRPRAFTGQNNLLVIFLWSCSIGLNRFNRKRFRLTQLTFSNGTLFQPFSVTPEIVITRLPCNLPGADRPRGNMAGAHRARAIVSFVLSDVLEEHVVRNEAEDELRECHRSCLQGVSGEQYRSRT